MGEGRGEDWKLRIAARIAAEIEDGVEDCGFVCLKRDVVAAFVLRVSKRKGRTWTYVARRDEREGEHFVCTSLPAQCQSTIAIDSKKRVDNSVVAAQVVVYSRCELFAGPTLNRHAVAATQRRAGMHQPLTARPDQRAFLTSPGEEGDTLQLRRKGLRLVYESRLPRELLMSRFCFLSL